MQVTLRLEGHLREFFPGPWPRAIQLDSPATVADVLGAAGIPQELPSAVLIRGVRVGLEYVPGEGDELVALSPMAGG